MDVSDLTNNASANGSVVATVRITLEAASVIWDAIHCCRDIHVSDVIFHNSVFYCSLAQFKI